MLRDIPCLVGAPPAMLNSWRKGKHQRVRSEFDESLNGQDLGTRLVELNKDGGDVGLTLENNQKNKTGVLVAAVATGKLAEVAGVAIGGGFKTAGELTEFGASLAQVLPRSMSSPAVCRQIAFFLSTAGLSRLRARRSSSSRTRQAAWTLDFLSWGRGEISPPAPSIAARCCSASGPCGLMARLA